MIAEGEAKIGMCELSIMSTKCSDRSFDLIECDFRSRSLQESLD